MTAHNSRRCIHCHFWSFAAIVIAVFLLGIGVLFGVLCAPSAATAIATITSDKGQLRFILIISSESLLLLLS